MDTRFWGKDGWIFLHSIAYNYNKEKENDHVYKAFFKSIQHILPCIYCRRSYKKYIKENPVDMKNLPKWIYTIHNLVNDKLRDQGYEIWPNPSFKEVNEKYSNIKLCIGFDFIYCILFNYNLDISEIRKKAYLTFFNSLKYILYDTGYDDYITQYPLEECFEKVNKLRLLTPLKKWGHDLERFIKRRCCSFKSRCEKIEKHRVMNCIEETCRKSIKKSTNK